MSTFAFLYVRDLGFILFLASYFIISQALIWGMARHSAETDFWRTAAVCFVVGWIAFLTVAAGTTGALTAGLLFGGLASWILLGFVFDLNLKDRIILTIALPIIALVCVPIGYWLKAQFVTSVMSS